MIIKSSFVVTKIIILVKAGLITPANVRNVLAYVTIMYLNTQSFISPFTSVYINRLKTLVPDSPRRRTLLHINGVDGIKN